MLSSLLETRPGRGQEFFLLLKTTALLITGPSAIIVHKRALDLSDQGFLQPALEQAALAAIAIYFEAVVVAMVEFIQTIRFFILWRNRSIPKSYARRLRGVGLPNFIVPIHQTDTGTEIIRRGAYLGIAILAGIIATVVALPSLIFSIRHVITGTEEAFVSMSLFILITIATGGNFLAAIVFTVERLDHERVIVFSSAHLRPILPTLYGLWIIFTATTMTCRIWVYSSSDPALRALARVYLFRVTTDLSVISKEGNAGHINAGPMYVSIREEFGVAHVPVSTVRDTQEISLEKVHKVE